MKLRIITIALILFLRLAGAAQDVQATFDASNKLYDQGRFTEAAAGYQELIQSGNAPASVYFNLGNAFIKSGQLGRGIAVYRMLENATPRDPDLKANLRFALAGVKGPSSKPGALTEWIRKATLNEWTLTTAGALWLTLILLALAQILPQLRRTLRGYALSGCVLTLLTGICLALSAHDVFSIRRGIVIAEEAPIRQAPLDEAATLFKVHDGAELRVLDRNDGWIQVSLDTRRTGWIRRDQVLAGK